MLATIGTLIIIFIAFILNAFAGFGAGIVAVPFLVLFYPLKIVAPFLTVIGLISNIFLINVFRKNINYKLLIPLVIGSFIGGLIGVHFLILTANGILIKILGIVIIISSLALYFFDKKINLRPSRGLSLVLGFLSGMLQIIFGVGGPPIILYVSNVLKDKSAIRAISLAFFLANGVVQVPILAYNKLLIPQVWLLCLFSIPVIFISNYIGHKIHLTVSEKLFQKIVLILLILAGILLLLK